MAAHESSVNYQNLIRDLADMYPLEVAEVIIVELVANSLDAGATIISIDYAVEEKILTISDNGSGMTPKQFDEYHDFAAGLKIRGSGIGFAGVGAKISFNIAERVVTETRSDSFNGGSNWYLKSKKKLLWEDIEPTYLKENGTRVSVHFGNKKAPPYSDTGALLHLLKRNYLPLFDQKFLSLYDQLGFYSSSMRFVVNGEEHQPGNIKEELILENYKEIFPVSRGKRYGYGFFGLSEVEYPFEPDVCGVLLCTHGKVIKADLFNQFPSGVGPRLIGIVEVPGFIDFLTTSKTDFFRGRGKNRKFENLYGPVRQEFKEWLAELGVQSVESSNTDDARKLENELKKMIDAVPELNEFFGFRTPSPVLQHADSGPLNAETVEGVAMTFPVGDGSKGDGEIILDEGEGVGNTLSENEKGMERARPISRSSRRGPKISFAQVPERTEISWVDGNSVTINSAHPSYLKASNDALAKRVFCIFAIGSAVQTFLSEPSRTSELTLIDRLLTAWGSK